MDSHIFRVFALVSWTRLRNARLLAASELRKWELESEYAPFDYLRFWKLTADGSVDTLTIADALFATERFDKQNEAVDSQRRQQQQSMSSQVKTSEDSAKKMMVKGPTGPAVMEQQRQKPYRRPTESCGGVGRAETSDRTSHKRPAACGSDIGLVDQNDPNVCRSNAAFPEEEIHLPPEFDRFGRRIKVVSNHADRRKLKRLKGPPEGTLIALGWGWGGEFRIGTGRDGFETWPRPLHPNFKVFLT